MMMKDQSFLSKYSKPILFFAVILMAAGIFVYQEMKTSLFPEVKFPKITLIADAGQLPADRMMITTTKPIESAIKRVNGVKTVRSRTSRGNSTIDVYFNWGMDMYKTKLLLESRINEIKNLLPNDVSLSIETMNQSLYPVYGYSLESEKYGPIALKNKAILQVRPLFSQIDGIANVIVRGGKDKEYVVKPDPVKMASLGITPDSIKQVFKNNNFVTSNGYVSDFRRLYLSLTDTRVNNARELGKVIIKNNGSRVVQLKDIADIEIQQQKSFVIVNANGNDAVQIDLVKQRGVNLVDFAQRVKEKAQHIRKILPDGVKLKPYYNQSAFVSASIDSVIECIWEGLLLAIIVMIVFLRSFRASLVVTLTIPLTLCLSVIILYNTGITLNIMSLGGIAAAIGLMIDDAIIIIEQIYRVHEDEPDWNRFAVVKRAIGNLLPAMVGSSLSTILIFLPFELLGGLAGSFFRVLSRTMIITLLASFFVTWLILPVLHLVIGYRSGNKPSTHEKQSENLKWLTRLFKKPIFAFLFTGIIIGAAFWASGNLATGFLPALDEGTIVLDYYTPPGTSLTQTDTIMRQVEKIIMANPEVESYTRRTGVHMGFKTVQPNSGDYLIQLKKGRKDKTVDVIDDLRKKITATQPALHVEFGQRIADLLGDLMSTPSPIEIKIFGDDQPTLEKLDHKAEEILSSIKGVVDIENGLVEAGPSIIFKPDQVKLARYNMTITDFQSQLQAYTKGDVLAKNEGVSISPFQAAMTSGIQLGQIQDGELMRRVLMRFTDFKNNSLEKIKNHLIFLPVGSTKPLSFFSDIKLIKGKPELKRENLKTDVVLTARLNNLDLGSAVQKIKARFKKDLNLPNGYTIEYGGAYSQQQSSFNQLLIILISASLLVLAIMMVLFRRWDISFLILLIAVLGITGCILGLYITGTLLNVSSYTGIIMIIGIIGENSVFTINQFFHNLKETNNVDEAINYAIALRVRPKLMTAIGAILALMPLALGIGVGAQMLQPLAIAVIGGFIVALPLLLFVLPSFLRLLYRRQIKK